MTTWLAIIAIGTTSAPSTDWAAASGLQVKELTTAEGTVHVYLPAHIAPGDTISGTVFAFGNGVSVAERNANTAKLQGHELTIEGRSVKLSEALFKFQVPTSASTLDIVVRDSNGSGAATGVVEVKPASGAYTGLVGAPIVEEGYAIRVLGSFDGDRDTTEAKLDGLEAGILAESPRECVVSTMNRGPGEHRLQVTEAQMSLDQQLNIARLTVTPPSEARVGKKSYMDIVVDGLKDADPRGFPLQVVLNTSTPELFDPQSMLALTINREDVVDGVYKGRLEFKMKKRGTYELTPQLVAKAP